MILFQGHEIMSWKFMKVPGFEIQGLAVLTGALAFIALDATFFLIRYFLQSGRHASEQVWLSCRLLQKLHYILVYMYMCLIVTIRIIEMIISLQKYCSILNLQILQRTHEINRMSTTAKNSAEIKKFNNLKFEVSQCFIPLI